MIVSTSGGLHQALQKTFEHGLSVLDWKLGRDDAVLEWCAENNFGTRTNIIVAFRDGAPVYSFDEHADFAFNRILGAWFRNERDAVLFKMRWG